MYNFKAGDEAILVSVEPQWKVPVGTKVRVRETCVGGADPGYFVELSTEPGSNIYYAEHRLGPVDDPLPPAPESVLYMESDSPLGTNSELRVKNSRYRGLLLVEMFAKWEGGGATAWAGRWIDPDAALQLAHDLRRMAMEIRRKERNG